MSDLIERVAVLEDLEKRMADDYVDAARFAEYIRTLPSAEPKPKWIPVTDSLPEDNRQVLVYAQSTHFALAKYDEMMEPDGKWKKQWVTFDAWKPFYTIKNVLAWMPLPEPYRENDRLNTGLKPFKSGNRWFCGECASALGRYWRYCQHCGQRIDWSEVTDESGTR